ncbi:hypothetical protein [Flavobacterium sp. W21_SRS_FM6]|uniref:hypothetical protein n=1 Tax=Flavobacterium sp. W21_SRS_FM6 TaxID=3240268 RepID=UPI003F929D05
MGQTSKDVEGVGLAFQFTIYDQVDEEQRTESTHYSFSHRDGGFPNSLKEVDKLVISKGSDKIMLLQRLVPLILKLSTLLNDNSD